MKCHVVILKCFESFLDLEVLCWSESYVSPYLVCHVCFLPVLSSIVSQEYVVQRTRSFPGAPHVYDFYRNS